MAPPSPEILLKYRSSLHSNSRSYARRDRVLRAEREGVVPVPLGRRYVRAMLRLVATTLLPPGLQRTARLCEGWAVPGQGHA